MLVDRLIDAVWGTAPPDTAGNALQVYVSQLRRRLQPGAAPVGPSRRCSGRPRR